MRKPDSGTDCPFDPPVFEEGNKKTPIAIEVVPKNHRRSKGQFAAHLLPKKYLKGFLARPW
jgi:hypothetical protein